MKRRLTTLASVACAALLTIPAFAGARKPATESSKTKVKTTNTIPFAWAPESLTGTVMTVDPARRIVTIRDSSGVPFDMVVNRSTRIQSGQRALKLEDLTSDVNKKASIRFVPERRGDMARTIRIEG